VSKVEQAKKVCIEETEAHKRELARRVQIFCETKGAAIEAQIAKQSALNESEAMTKLTNIVNMLEGIEPNGKQNGEITATINKLKQKVKIANEAKTHAIELANRKTAIAEKALKRNRQLATAIKEMEDNKLTSKDQVVEESVQSQPKRIDSTRNAGRPKSTRATLVENQTRQTATSKPPRSGFNINSIAEDME
jgi:hypothetical protein